MASVQHTCTGCVPIDASIIDVYVTLVNTNKYITIAETDRAAAENARETAETERASLFATDHGRAVADHSIAESDHQTASADHASTVAVIAEANAAAAIANAKAELVQARLDTADADHTRAEGDHGTAVSDHSTASTDHTMAQSDHETAGNDHTRAESDHSIAASDHTASASATAAATGAAELANTKAGLVQEKLDRADTDHDRAESDHTIATSDHTAATADHAQASADHTQAGTDHGTAVEDHTSATTDHAQAGEDHTLAAADHVTAGEDHTQAQSDHAVMQGYDTRLANAETDVSQLDAEIDEKFGAEIPASLTIEQGSISSSNGQDSSSASRLRNNGFIDADSLHITATNGDVYVYGYQQDGTYIGAGSAWQTGVFTAEIAGAKKYRLSFKRTSGASLTPADFDTLGISVKLPNNGIVVQLVPQSLTDSEKITARTNIGAASAEDVSVMGEKVDGISGQFEEGSETKTDEILFQPVAGYINTSGSSGGASSYVNTGEIPVGQGDVLSLQNQNGVFTMRFVCALVNGVADSTKGASSATSFTVPEGVTSVILSTTVGNADGTLKYKRIYTDKKVVLKSSALQMDSTPTSGSVNPVTSGGVFDAINNDSNVLKSKKWVACGDSFTHGDFANSETDDYIIESGQYAGQYKVYPFLIGNRNGMTIVNEAINGSTLTHIDGRTNAFSDTRYQQIPSDADYITLKFGINDDANHQNVPIGTINDATNATFYGAWNVVLDYLIRNHPQAKIGIIVTNGATLEIANATLAICQKWGIAYLNEATDEHCSFVFRTNRTDIVSSIRSFRDNYWHVSNTEGARNYHPNEKAHEFESTVVESWLRSL